MPTPSFASLGSREPTNAEIADYLARQRRDMQYLLTNLDDLNISRLNARVIIAGSITSDKIAAKSITADQIAAGTITAAEIATHSITADRMNVTELSAISANMGKLTSGEIYGAYIATSEGTFPRSEMSSINQLFAAYSSANSYVALTPNQSGAPGYVINDSGLKLLLQYISGVVAFLATTGIQINANGGDLYLDSSGNITIPSWSRLVNRGTGLSLQTTLNNKLDVTGVSASFTSMDGKTVTVINGAVALVV